MRRFLMALVVLASLVATACESPMQPVASTSTPTAPVASPPTSGMLVLARRDRGAPQSMTLQLVDLRGRVAARVSFAAPASGDFGGCAAVLPPAVRVAADAAYYADSAGAIHRVDTSGATSVVATFKLTSPQQLLSCAVSPDGRKLIAVVVSTPPLKTPVPPPPPYDPFVAGGHWTLDLETAVQGGSTTVALHEDLGTTGAGGATMITGWDDRGPTATLNSLLCVQNPVPSVEYPGDTLVHLAADGSHLDVIGGAGCRPWDELHDGTVLCGGTDSEAFTVRTGGGSTLWTGRAGNFMEARLSPDAGGVTVNSGPGIVLRDQHQTASIGRLTENGPTVGMLGWAGSHYAVVVRLSESGRLGLVPAANPSDFVDLGVSLGDVCFDCVPPGATLAGTIGIS